MHAEDYGVILVVSVVVTLVGLFIDRYGSRSR